MSINHVDCDGNSALHLAAANNLTDCLVKLLACGAIISVVNKDQKNCCELADLSNFKTLADALELAVLYQMEDDEMALFNAEQRFPYENQKPIFSIETK